MRAGHLVLRRPQKGFVVVELHGHCSEVVEEYIAAMRAQYRVEPEVHHFFDASTLAGYATSARITLTNFAIAERAHVASATFLVTAPIVAMGVSAAALAARLAGLDFVVCRTRAEFDAKYEAALRAAKIGGSGRGV